MSNKNVVLSVPMTYAGVNYGAGLNELPEAAAKSAIRRKLGEYADGDTEKEGGDTAAGANFEPLGFEETMKRFERGDFSDEVMKSLQHHQETVKEFRSSGLPPGEFLKKLEEEKAAFDKLPKNFPQRHVFAKLGEEYDSVEKIQAKPLKDLIELDGIADGSARAALAYKREV